MATAGTEARFDPLRLQKYFFLLDRELDGECGCPHFDFRRHEYGPFDSAVFSEVAELVRGGLAVVDTRRPYRVHALTEEGMERGNRTAADLPGHVLDYFAVASSWVLSVDLRELLEAIYEYAPEMAGSTGLPGALASAREATPHHPFLRGMARAFDWPAPARVAPGSRDDVARTLGRTWAEVGGYLREAMYRTRQTVEGS